MGMATSNEIYSSTLGTIDAVALCRIARPLVRAKARRLSERPGFTRSDQEEIEQNAFVRLLERFADAREAHAVPVIAFIKQVVNQSMANQLRDRWATKRDPRRTTSLGQTAASGSSSEKLDIAHPLSGNDAAESLVDLALDVDEVISRLTQERQELCSVLGVESVAELARRFERPRTTLNDEVSRLRRTFESAGLRGYLE